MVGVASLAKALVATLGPHVVGHSGGGLVKGLSDVPAGVQWAERTAEMIRAFRSDASRWDLSGNATAEKFLEELRLIQLQGEEIGERYRREFGVGKLERWVYSIYNPIGLAYIKDDVNNMTMKMCALKETAEQLEAIDRLLSRTQADQAPPPAKGFLASSLISCPDCFAWLKIFCLD